MPDLGQFPTREAYYAALDEWFARQYGEAENDCE